MVAIAHQARSCAYSMTREPLYCNLIMASCPGAHVNVTYVPNLSNRNVPPGSPNYTHCQRQPLIPTDYHWVSMSSYIHKRHILWNQMEEEDRPRDTEMLSPYLGLVFP